MTLQAIPIIWYLLSMVCSSGFVGSLPPVKTLKKLKPAIANIWNGMAMLANAEHDYIITRNYSSYINEHLELSIVDFADIPERGNREDLYIPLFENGGGFFVI